MPTPLCNGCIVALQSQEIPRLSFYVTAYHELLERFKELEHIHNQKMFDFKNATENIVVLRAKLAALHKGQTQGAAAASTSSQPLAQPLANAQNTSVSSSEASKNVPVIDWVSDSGKFVSTYLLKQRETLVMCQKECEHLKTVVAKLTATLEAKNKPDQECITATEKAELMEAELEGLHERLGKCEEDLENAQSELTKTKTQNVELTKELTGFRQRASQTRNTLSKAQVHIISLQNRCATAERELALARESLKAKDEALRANARSPRGPSTDLPTTSVNTEERTAVYVPTAAEFGQTASMLVSLQNEVARLNREKAAIQQQIVKLKALLESREEENKVLGGKLLKSAELASELGRIHLAASSRAETAEEKLSAAESELQRLKELVELQEKERSEMQSMVDIASGLSKQAEYQARIVQLELELADVTRLRDEALTQLEAWEHNRNAWKRWGEVMAFRAKQWEAESLKTRTPRKDPFTLGLEEPPPLSPIPLGPLSEKTRKRPLDIPDTDVDGLHATAQPSADNTSAPHSSGEGSERKRPRFSDMS